MYLSDKRASSFRRALRKLFAEYDKLFPSTGGSPSQEELLFMQNIFGADHYRKEGDVVFDHAEGVWIWDKSGKRYLDANACYSAVALGYGDIELLGAMTKQAFRMTVAQNRFVNDMQPQLVARIAELTGQDCVILKNAGTEAFDCAVKAARRWAVRVKKLEDGKAEIITLGDNFHGRSLAAIAASSNAKYRKHFGPFPPGFMQVPAGDIEALRAAITKNTAAFICEVIQGEGGINVQPMEYFREVRALCDAQNVLLIFDEIQTGLGRTGKLFASEWTGVAPDGVLLGKALGQAIPVSAFAGRSEVMELFDHGSDGSTFAGTALPCAVALKSLEIITRDNCAVVKNAAAMGEYFLAELRKIRSPLVREVRGKGLFIGIEFFDQRVKADVVFTKLKELGMITGVAGNNTVRITTALVITKSEVDIAVDTMARALKILERE